MTLLNVVAVVLSLAANSVAAAPRTPHWATVNGHRIYYETAGTGRPLLLLHGGGSSIEGSFNRQLDLFSRERSVIAIEQVGHGHTPDVPGPLSYGGMAGDTAALLVSLHLSDVDVVGWSDGGILALILALRHPELVHRVVVSGANIAPEGLSATDLKLMREKEGSAKNDAAKQTMDMKLNHLALTSPTHEELSPEMLATLRKRVLVMAGDHDEIPLEHTLQIARALPSARLCILPGTGHATFLDRPEWVNPIVLTFLSEP